jgi:hypothetical protein
MASAHEARARAAVALLLAALAPGCATWAQQSSAGAVAGACLATASAAGAERLRVESSADATVRDFVAREGRPDHLYVLDRKTLYLFYSARDRVAVFQRSGLLGASEVEVIERIPGSLLRELPPAERERIAAARAREERHAAAARPRPAARRAPPAAPERGSEGFTLRRFDVDEIVDRLRRPITAADPGVGDWRRSLLPDGTLRRTGRAGSTRFEVRPDAVSAATAIAGAAVHTPSATRLAIARINDAVFAASANGVNEIAWELVERVARDPSGHTALARRVAGRTIRCERSREHGLLIYAVFAH